MPIRYLMIAGFAVLALVYFHDLKLATASGVDYEQILPAAILQFAPVGVLGLLLAGMLAAFISTFAATINTAPAYLVNDIYKRYVNPEASSKSLIYASYAVSLIVVVISTLIALYVSSINSVLVWLVSGLWGGYTAANVLKWYWWRLNGFGFFWGMMVGILCALLFPNVFGKLFPAVPSDILPLYLFPLILVVSGSACILGSLLTKPDDEALLKTFYRNVRPWGFWGPILAKVQQDDPEFTANPYFKRDLFNIVVGTCLQTTLVALPIFIVIKMPVPATVSAVIIGVAILILRKTWYANLVDWPKDEIAREKLLRQQTARH